MRRKQVQRLAVPSVDIPERCVTNPHRLFEHRREHWLNIASGTADDLEHTSEVAVCCSSASVRSVVRWRRSWSNRAFSMAMTALGREARDQRDLLVDKWTNFLTNDCDNSNDFVIFKHRHSHGGANSTKLDCFNCSGLALRIKFGRCEDRGPEGHMSACGGTVSDLLRSTTRYSASGGSQ